MEIDSFGNGVLESEGFATGEFWKWRLLEVETFATGEFWKRRLLEVENFGTGVWRVLELKSFGKIVLKIVFYKRRLRNGALEMKHRKKYS